MASLREKVEAELEQMDHALRELPSPRQVRALSVLDLGGTACLLSSLYHGVENILKQQLLAARVALPTGAAWHRDLLQAAREHGLVSAKLRDQLAPYMAFRHFFAHAYGFDLDPERMKPLVREIRAVYGCFKRETRGFLRKKEARERPPKAGRRAP